ncbi:hypothetical protein [Thermotomaculum hydrothermale]|uniref:hypothetical protein n=1 Tax=Thermotomaculum hydrothermale TaxID=981385 RepID=UPI001915D599|nr:hypothetical protein [Thermotomaculum hydrothermale]
MRRLKLNYYGINISLSLILFSLSYFTTQTEINIIGVILSAIIFIYGITGVMVTLFIKKCLICSKYFISLKYEICNTCHARIESKIQSSRYYFIEYPYSSRDSFKTVKSNSPSTTSSPASRFIE